eukprot:260130-Pleurochrysis_carterae.AAC.2
MLGTLQAASTTANGKKNFSAFVSAHKRMHCGMNPGPAGVPLLSAGPSHWIIDLLLACGSQPRQA